MHNGGIIWSSFANDSRIGDTDLPPANGPDRPLPNSYWVIPGRFAAGEYPGARDATEAAARLRTLLAAGIDHFIDLTESVEGLEPYAEIARGEARRLDRQVVHERHPIADLGVPGTPREMVEILDAIDRSLDDGRTVYLHCWGGVGRTATVVGCWLVRHGRTGNEALRQVVAWWQGVAKVRRKPQSPETAEQSRYVREWTEPAQEERAPNEPSVRERFRGCLLGLAAGDALGPTVEFRSPGSFEPIDGMVGGGPFDLEPGQWTDDTSMALCLATSLIECGGFDARDQMQRYLRWWREGYLSSTGRCFDIGNTVRAALARFEQGGDPYAGSTDPQSAGNGSLMRLAPVPMYFAADVEDAVAMAASSSQTTHGALEAVDACRYFAALLVGALEGTEKETLLNPDYWPIWWDREPEPLAEAIERIARGSYKDRNPPGIRGTGYVVDALEAALWAFHHSRDFRDGALLTVNLGDDADTTGAIYGQLAGAYYGVESIPVEWRERLTMAAEITSLADQLYDHARAEMPPEPDAGRTPEEVSVMDETADVAGVRVRWINIVVDGHTVEQLVYYDTAEAEAVFGRPFDEEMDREIQEAMHAVDRIALGGRMHKAVSASTWVIDACTRWTSIDHCGELEPGGGGWNLSRADGDPVESNRSGCVSGAPAISHRGLTAPDDALDGVELPAVVSAARLAQRGIEEYIGAYTTALREVLTGRNEKVSGADSTVTEPRYVMRPGGRSVQIDDQGWVLTKRGRRDLRYSNPTGPGLPRA